MEEMLFNILIPVYKTEKYVEACIQSVLAQEDQRFRIIVVDDGSPDHAGEICDALAQKDERIIVLHQENRGLIAARDAAIRWVSACEREESIVLFLDSDDMMAPGALTRIRRLFQSENPDVVMFSWNRITSDGILIAQNERSFAPFTLYNKAEVYRKVFFNCRYNSLCLKAVKSHVLTKTDYSPYYAISYGEDLLRSIDIYRNAQSIKFVPDALYLYRDNPKSITHQENYDDYRLDSTVRKTVWEFLNAEDVWTSADYADYLKIMRQYLSDEIWQIAVHTSSLSNCRRVLGQILSDAYYQTVLGSVCRRDYLLRLLNGRKFGWLYLLGRGVKQAIHLKQALHRG